MSSPAEPQSIKPPPIEQQARPDSRPRFQFNTASLLGAMALVAVVCAVAMTVPGLLALAGGLIATAGVVAYAAFLMAGAFVGKGDNRLFATAAGVGLAVSTWSMPNAILATYFMDGGGLSPAVATSVWSILAPLQHILLSLFAGWVALRAAKFWSSQEP